jgi:hypothetical protein
METELTVLFNEPTKTSSITKFFFSDNFGIFCVFGGVLFVLCSFFGFIIWILVCGELGGNNPNITNNFCIK